MYDYALEPYNCLLNMDYAPLAAHYHLGRIDCAIGVGLGSACPNGLARADKVVSAQHLYASTEPRPYPLSIVRPRPQPDSQLIPVEISIALIRIDYR